jgi:amino acid transporter
LLIIVLIIDLPWDEESLQCNIMVVVKLCIVLLVIAVGVFYVDTANWDPFAPNGVTEF